MPNIRKAEESASYPELRVAADQLDGLPGLPDFDARVNDDQAAYRVDLPLEHPVLSNEQEQFLFNLLREARIRGLPTNRVPARLAWDNRLFSAEATNLDDSSSAQWRYLREACETVEEIIVRCNQRLIALVAHPYKGLGLPFHERLRAGQGGLIRALRQYDPDRDARFITMAQPWVRASIQEEDARQHGVRLTVVKTIGIGRMFSYGFTQATGREPTTEELFKILVAYADHKEGRPLVYIGDAQVIADFLTGRAEALSLDSQRETRGDGVELHVASRDSGVDVDTIIDVRHAMSLLPEMWQALLAAEFGLDEAGELSDVGKRFGLDGQAVEVELKAAVSALRSMLHNLPDANTPDGHEPALTPALPALTDDSRLDVLALAKAGYRQSEICRRLAAESVGRKISRQRVAQIINWLVDHGLLDEPPLPNEEKARRVLLSGLPKSAAAAAAGISKGTVARAAAKLVREGFAVTPEATNRELRLSLLANETDDMRAFRAWLMDRIAQRR